jgi:hypothetical protein
MRAAGQIQHIHLLSLEECIVGRNATCQQKVVLTIFRSHVGFYTQLSVHRKFSLLCVPLTSIKSYLVI